VEAQEVAVLEAAQEAAASVAARAEVALAEDLAAAVLADRTIITIIIMAAGSSLDRDITDPDSVASLRAYCSCRLSFCFSVLSFWH
jgi:hypothetical protein